MSWFITSLGATVLGSLVQNKAQRNAANNQAQLSRLEMQRQQKFQQAAEQTAANRVQDYGAEQRTQNQQQLAEQATQELSRPIKEVLPSMNEATAAQGNVSSDYTAAKAKSTTDQLASAEALARIMGKITGANRLRTNEAVKMMDAGQTIDQLRNFSANSQNVGAYEVQQAETPNGNQMMLGGLLSGLGKMGLGKGGPWGG